MRTATIIPVWNPNMDKETVDVVKHNIDILRANTDIIFISPEGLDWSNLDGLDQLGCIIEYEPIWFESVKKFSLFMTLPLLYDDLSDYDYLLICQEDVWIFDNQVEKWVNKDYDYIGAPWMFAVVDRNVGNLIHKVGNGGFSLRKTDTFLKLTTDNMDTIEEANGKGINEDLIFSILLGDKLKKPEWEEAMYFAWETKPFACFKMINTTPFGWHGFKIYNKPLYETLILRSRKIKSESKIGKCLSKLLNS